jgi:hypothetical protein
MLQYAFQGQMFDAAMAKFTVQFMAYNANLDRLVDQRVRFTRNSGGCFDITKEARALQVRDSHLVRDKGVEQRGWVCQQGCG